MAWVPCLYPHWHDNRAMYVRQSLFQQCDGVILVLQLLCDLDKCILRCLESIMNICGFLALPNDFIKPMFHPSYLNLHVFYLLTMLTHYVCHLLNNLFQYSELILHFVALRLPLVSLPFACDQAMDGPPSIFTLLAKKNSKPPKNSSQDLFKKI
jgi:hypothetical protein